MKRLSAEILALEALRWAAETGALPDFLDHSGMEISDLRERAGDPEVHAALLDYILSQDALTKSLSERLGIEPSEFHMARRELPSGAFES